jgi:hypothetical protein
MLLVVDVKVNLDNNISSFWHTHTLYNSASLPGDVLTCVQHGCCCECASMINSIPVVPPVGEG